MTRKIINYGSRTEFLIDSKIQARNGFRTLHYDSPHKITYVNGTDDPDNTPQPPKRQLTERQLLDEIAEDRNVIIT